MQDIPEGWGQDVPGVSEGRGGEDAGEEDGGGGAVEGFGRGVLPAWLKVRSPTERDALLIQKGPGGTTRAHPCTEVPRS